MRSITSWPMSCPARRGRRWRGGRRVVRATGTGRFAADTGSVGLSNQVWRVVTDEALRVSTSLTRLSISCDLARAASAGLPGHQDKSGRARAPLPNGRGEAELALADPECHAKGRLARVASQGYSSERTWPRGPSGEPQSGPSLAACRYDILCPVRSDEYPCCVLRSLAQGGNLDVSYRVPGMVFLFLVS